MNIFTMILFFFLLAIRECNGFMRPTTTTRRPPLLTAQMLDDSNINIIQRYKFYIEKRSVSDMLNDINKEKFSDVFISNDYKQLVGVDKTYTGSNMYDQFHLSYINPIEVPSIVNQAYAHHIQVKFIDFNGVDILKIVVDVASNLLPSILLFLVLRSVFLSIRQGGGGNNPLMGSRLSIGQTDKFVTPNISLNSWAGSPEVLEECREVVSYLDNKTAYKQTGAEMPRGILLEGPPGTGKTLLAKGIASETKSNFVSVSGAEFVEIFVGVGAARVRDLFKNARNKAPCVIFIDEIDAVGKQRGGQITTNDEREQTLNQILYEMDGFNNNEGLLVLAATNRKDILDKALLRPGRFDRIIKVPLPDRYSRGKILDYYFSQKPMEPRVDTTSLAEITDGFSGAELKNLVNEAAILAARQNRTVIRESDLFSAFEKSIVGLIRNKNDASLTTKLRVAIHESGHAILSMQYPQYFELQKVSIQATYNGAGGYTIFTEKPDIKEGGLYTRDILKKRLVIMLGGKAAENLYYGRDFVSLGAVQDLKQANQLAQKMVGNFGMGDTLEVFYNENIDETVFGRTDKYSEYTKHAIDKETLDLVAEAYNESKLILSQKKDLMIDMAELLLRKTVLNKKDFSKMA